MGQSKSNICDFIWICTYLAHVAKSFNKFFIITRLFFGLCPMFQRPAVPVIDSTYDWKLLLHMNQFSLLLQLEESLFTITTFFQLEYHKFVDLILSWASVSTPIFIPILRRPRRQWMEKHALFCCAYGDVALSGARIFVFIMCVHSSGENSDRQGIKLIILHLYLLELISQVYSGIKPVEFNFFQCCYFAASRTWIAIVFRNSTNLGYFLKLSLH